MAVILCVGNAVLVAYEHKGRESLEDKIYQQQYQLEVLVSRFNNKQAGEVAEFNEDGTVWYWKTYHRGTADSVMAVDTTYYYR